MYTLTIIISVIAIIAAISLMVYIVWDMRYGNWDHTPSNEFYSALANVERAMREGE